MKKGTMVLEHLNFFNEVSSELLTVDVKINEEDKALILLSSFSQLYNHIITTMLYNKETLILKEFTSTLLFNEIRKRPSQEEQIRLGLVAREGKEEKKERKV